MDKVKRLVFINVPMSICNFRCSYCYLAQREKYYQGKQPNYMYSPKHVGKALSIERLGGVSYVNFCAEGETLLANNIDKYVYEILKAGHYVEFITNLTVTNVLEKMLSWDKELLQRLEFKCSFHYLELKKKGWLERFAANVKNVWEAGASANIEITPSDDLIPYLDEVKDFSMNNFGSLPHLSIARRDDTKEIDYLTQLSMEEYDKIWGEFDSEFWQFKKTIFKNKRNEFCYAGDWSIYIDLATGRTVQCYRSNQIQDIFKNIEKPIKFRAIGKCKEPHCFNGHSLLTLGCIPNFTNVKYGNIRNRIKTDGTEWLQPQLKSFFNSSLVESNCEYSASQKRMVLLTNSLVKLQSYAFKAKWKLLK